MTHRERAIWHWENFKKNWALDELGYQPKRCDGERWRRTAAYERKRSEDEEV